MKLLFVACGLLVLEICSAQLKPVAVHVSEPSNPMASSEQTISIDSFKFLSHTFKVPRDCNGKFVSNCATYASDPDQLGFCNGKTLVWFYFISAESPEQFLENAIKDYAINEDFQKQQVICKVLNESIKGYRIKHITKTGYKQSLIITAIKNEDKIVLIEFQSESPVRKNKGIPAGLKQIFQLID